MNNLCKALFFIVLFSSLASAQTKTGVLCRQKQLWLVNEAQAVSIGKCAGGKDWLAPVELKDESADKIVLSKDEKQVSDALRQTTKESFKPVRLAQAPDIAQKIQSQPNKSVVVLNSNLLPNT